MVLEKAQSTKEDKLAVIQERKDHFNKEYSFELVKSMPERIRAVIKAQSGEATY